jgi:hypothetical protein
MLGRQERRQRGGGPQVRQERRTTRGEARRARATAARRARALGQANDASLDLGHGGNENLKKKIPSAGNSYQWFNNSY